MRRPRPSPVLALAAPGFLAVALLALFHLGVRAYAASLDADRTAQVRSVELPVIRRVVELFARQQNRLPAHANDLAMWMHTAPDDPWGTPYRVKRAGSVVRVASLGADRKPGGEGVAADIDCWVDVALAGAPSGGMLGGPLMQLALARRQVHRERVAVDVPLYPSCR